MKNLAWHFEELKNTYIKGTIGVTLNNPPLKKGTCPIYNSTLETLIWLRNNDEDVLFFFFEILQITFTEKPQSEIIKF